MFLTGSSEGFVRVPSIGELLSPCSRIFWRLSKHVHDRMESLDMHCVACDRKVFYAKGMHVHFRPWMQATRAAACGHSFRPALCQSLACKKAVKHQLPLYLHPASLDLLISLVGAALQAEVHRRRLIFGDSVMIDQGYWLEGMVVDQEPQWETMQVKLDKVPMLEQQAPATTKAHRGDPPLFTPHQLGRADI
eukprot:jgi/Botrbrau1/9456/Bobra.0252s0077.1